MATLVAFVAVPAVAAFKFATCVVLATTKGVVPVITVEVITPEADTVVNAPVLVVVAPTVPLILIDAVPVRLVTTPLEGVPNAGVTSVGEVAKTAEPEPVSSVSAPESWADVNDPKDVAFPTEVTAPVKLALVVTLPAVKPAAVPVIFVPIRAEGVPNAGVTRVGEVARTLLPVPVFVTLTTCLLALRASAVEAVKPDSVVVDEAVSVVNAASGDVRVVPSNVKTDPMTS